MGFDNKSDSVSDPEIEILPSTDISLDYLLEDTDMPTRPVAADNPHGDASQSPAAHQRYTPMEIAELDMLVEKHCQRYGITDIQPYMPEHQLGGMSRAYGGFSYAPDDNGSMKATPYFVKAAINGDSELLLEEGHNHLQISLKTDVVPHVAFLEKIKLSNGKKALLIAMEHVVGENLLEYTNRKAKEGKPLTECERLSLFRKVVLAISDVHKAGYVHRDIKPENVVLYGNDADVRVVDFGLASKIGEPPKNRSLICTPHYASPEHLENKVDARMDVYSLGCMLYELLTGTTPFNHVIADKEGRSPEHISEELPNKLYQAMLKEEHITDPSPEIKEKLERLSSDTALIVNTCMKRDPEERWQNCDALANALKEVIEPMAIAYIIMNAPDVRLAGRPARRTPASGEHKPIEPATEAYVVDAVASMICGSERYDGQRSTGYSLVSSCKPARSTAGAARRLKGRELYAALRSKFGK